MARSDNAYDRMEDVRRRHWNAVARENTMGREFEVVIGDMLARTTGVVESVGARLPGGFPAKVG